VVIDSSVIVAILLEEPEATLFAHAIAQDRIRLMSAVSALEVNLVMGGRTGPGAIREFDLALHRSGIELVPFNAEQFELARAAWLRFGKAAIPQP
jgi:ribonuclease VapC